MSLTAIIAAVAAILTVTIALTEGINRIFKIQKNWVKQLIAWISSILCTFLAYFMGYIEGVPDHLWWVWVLVIGILVGLAANGIWDITKWFKKSKSEDPVE